MYGCRGWDELERYGAGKRGRGRVRGGSPLPASASARDNTGQGDVLAALGRQEVGRVRGRVALGYGPGAREGGRAGCGVGGFTRRVRRGAGVGEPASAGGSRHGLVVLVVSAGSVDVVLLPGVDAGRGGFGGRAQRRGDPRNA